MRWITCAVVGLASMASVAWGWGLKEHIQLTRLAAERSIADPATPPAMKRWLAQAMVDRLDAAGERDYFLHQRVGIAPRGIRGLTYWAIEPDLVAMKEKSATARKPVAPFGVGESKLHYLDVELFLPGAREGGYREDLSHRPDLRDFPHDLRDERYRRAGMLPFRVEDAYRRLVRAIRADDLTEAPDREHAVKWAGYLAHYAADNVQPHHATVDYKSRSYFPGVAEPPDVHGQMEYVMGDTDGRGLEELRREYWAAFTAALENKEQAAEDADVWRASVAASLKSYEALPLIGHAAVAAAGHAPAEFDTIAFFHFKGACGGRTLSVLEMKAAQQAWAVKRIQRLWRKAWDEAQGERKATGG